MASSSPIPERNGLPTLDCMTILHMLKYHMLEIGVCRWAENHAKHDGGSVAIIFLRAADISPTPSRGRVWFALSFVAMLIMYRF